MSIITINGEEYRVSEMPISEMRVINLLWVAGRVLDMSDLRMIAAAIAESVLHIYESEFPGDYRPREVIKASRLLAMDEIGLSEASAIDCNNTVATRRIPLDAVGTLAAARAAARAAFVYAPIPFCGADYYSYLVTCASDSALRAAHYYDDSACREVQRQREIVGAYLREV